MTTANERQIGGGHYQSTYQHWDWVLKTGIGYLEACATKYVSRWRRKDGVQGLEKAEHYVQKIMENEAKVLANRPVLDLEFNREEALEFAAINKLDYRETCVCEILATWTTQSDLRKAQAHLQDLIFVAKLDTTLVTPRTDSNKHAVEDPPDDDVYNVHS